VDEADALRRLLNKSAKKAYKKVRQGPLETRCGSQVCRTWQSKEIEKYMRKIVENEVLPNCDPEEYGDVAKVLRCIAEELEQHEITV